ncbi:hypothetical protein [Stenotrophomonas sp. NPDC077659]
MPGVGFLCFAEALTPLPGNLALARRKVQDVEAELAIWATLDCSCSGLS